MSRFAIMDSLITVDHVGIIVQQPRDGLHGDRAGGKINFGDQFGDERHQPVAVLGVDLQHVLRREVQHGPDGSDPSSLDQDGQTDQLPVVEFLGVIGPVVGRNLGDQLDATMGFGGIPVPDLGKADQPPRGAGAMLRAGPKNSQLRRRPGARCGPTTRVATGSDRPEHLPGGVATFGFIGA